jgi:two-component system, OmpR family, copper resistance phosphate regulon response regulator CusR
MQDVRILVVEDERKLAEVLASALRAEHYDVVLAPTGEDGFFRVQAETFDVVLLDLMLPGRNGLEILQTLRKRHVQTPVLILTARDGIDDRVLGLDLGADDYLIKPFALPELLARIRALLRRGRPTETLRLKAGDLELDLMSRRVTRAGRPLDLTAREFELLEYLLRNQGHVVSREMLAHEVWQEPRRATPIDNVIDVQVARLRRKVDSDEAIGSMLEEIDRMSTLVETLLRLSRGDAGSIRLSRETVDLGELARDVAASLGVLAEERNQTIDFDVPDGLTITADRLVLREAVTNVLDNAIKYGPERSASRFALSGPGTRHCWRSLTMAPASHLRIASASSTASSGSTRRARGNEAEQGSGWRLPDGRSRSTAGGSPRTDVRVVAPSSGCCCRSRSLPWPAGRTERLPLAEKCRRPTCARFSVEPRCKQEVTPC